MSLSAKWDFFFFYCNPSYSCQSAETVTEQEAERLQELWNGQECYGMLSSGHSTVIAPRNSQHLWLPAQDQAAHKSSMDGWAGGVHRVPLLAEELL